MADDFNNYVTSDIIRYDEAELGAEVHELRPRIFSIVLMICTSMALFAQESDAVEIDVYGLGDQTFSISAGVILPLFFFGLDASDYESGFNHLRVGAAGALRWATFLGNNASVGAELGGMFESTVLTRTLISIPLTGTIDYAFRFYPFEVSIHGNLGVNFLRLDNDLYIGPIIKPGASFYWNYNSEWSFGLRAEYWFIPEVYFGSTASDLPPSSHTRFGNFLTLNLSTLYHF